MEVNTQSKVQLNIKLVIAINSLSLLDDIFLQTIYAKKKFVDIVAFKVMNYVKLQAMYLVPPKPK